MEKTTRKVRIGTLTIGGALGDKKIAIQSMLNVPADDVEGNVRQAIGLEEAGCEIQRVAVPNLEAVRLIPAIKRAIKGPLVADIHFDHRIALACVAEGVDKIRINPGNVGGDDHVKQVADACRRAGIPIRIGVNGGSLEPELLRRYGAPTAQALVDSAAHHIDLLTRHDFSDIVVSLKSSNVKTMITACRLFAERYDFPLHLGVTETGTPRIGRLKSAIGIGSLLVDGIGDTIRVSLTADPLLEVEAAADILRGAGLGGGIEIIACPTCGRTRIDLIRLAQQVEKALSDIHEPIKVAVMGCAVNGPGEAREADVGIAGGDGEALLFRHGKVLRKIPQEDVVSALRSEVLSILEERE